MSLRNRVTLAAVLTLGVGLLISGIALNLVLATRLSADADTILENRADALLATLDTRAPTLRVRDNGGDAVLDEQAWVFDADGKAVERPPVDDEVNATASGLARVTQPTTKTIEEEVRLLAAPIPGGLGTVVVGLSLEPYERTEHFAALGTVLLGLLVVGAGTLLARRAVGTALRPVADMTAQAEDWSEHDLDRRFRLGPPRDELTALAATLDGLLGRIAAVIRHEHRFSAEMAHELRTPLSGVRAEGELALLPGRSEDDLRAAIERMVAGTDRMAAVIDTLLAAARQEGNAPVGSSDAVAVARTLAIEPNVRVIAPRGPVKVGADAEVVAAALHPVLENAVRHARSAIVIEIARDGQDVVVSVTNDGSKIPVADTERIFTPGVSGTGGAGLGLPLARRLARAAGGELTAVAPQARFELRLPAA
ncbi:sensor histidine kinase [Solirubrobacter soli]|uniref:sensor histidine kinase n=1 Tax=Solirubrobacter soli TaxID=363832 RepID=UPI0003FA52AA|nr:ATP-binding protein [Solirubrobacter soli]